MLGSITSFSSLRPLLKTRNIIFGTKQASRRLSALPEEHAHGAKFKSVLKTLSDRGYLHQCTDFSGLDSVLASEPRRFYLGFDATASSLHIGSLIQLMILRTFQKAGHKPVVLIGGGTTKVGDPSGKDTSRQMLSEEAISANVESISKIFKKFLSFESSAPNAAIIVNNADWLCSINYIDFLRDYGKLFSVNRMLTMDSVRTRLEREQPLTFLEFNYLLLQAYDFVELHKRHEVVLQVGGSDQWGNIVSGVELGRKIGTRQALFGLTTPLLLTHDGKKMGKSAAGAIWLDKELLSEFEYWQYWRNVDDADVIRFLKLFTDISLERIESIAANFNGREINNAKVLLADETTKLLHGEDCLEKIHSTAKALFSHAAAVGMASLDSLPTFLIASKEFTAKEASRGHCKWIASKDVSQIKDKDAVELVENGVFVADLLVVTKLASSKGAARRLIAGSGVKVNDHKVSAESEYVTADDFSKHDGKLKLSAGKKAHAVIEIIN